MNKMLSGLLISGATFFIVGCNRPTTENENPSREDMYGESAEEIHTKAQSVYFWQSLGECTDIKGGGAQQLHDEFTSCLQAGTIVLQNFYDEDTRDGRPEVTHAQETTITADLVDNGKVVAHLFYRNDFFKFKDQPYLKEGREMSFSLVGIPNQVGLNNAKTTKTIIYDFETGTSSEDHSCNIY